MGERALKIGGALRELKPLHDCSGGLGLLWHACSCLMLIRRRKNLLRVLSRGSAGTRVTGGGGVSESAKDAAFHDTGLAAAPGDRRSATERAVESDKGGIGLVWYDVLSFYMTHR
jgi:hypothetical protein